MNNQTTEEQKSALTKSLAIVGLIAAVIFAVWLAVQVVKVIPSAFSSLASIADSVYNYDGSIELTAATSEVVVNSGDSFVITWNEVRPAGFFTFSYSCAEGIALSLRTQESDIVSLECDTAYNLDQATEVEVMLSTERQRFTDVDYQVTFIAENDTITDTIASNTITIVNASIPAGGLAVIDEGEEGTPEPQPITLEEAPAPVASPAVPSSQPEPTYVEEVVYAIPVSNPSGFTDLKVTYLGVGIEKNGVFTKAGTIATDQKGAIQFSVKNIGTKTSEVWGFEAKLPSSIAYQSPTQTVLKPNEEAIFTLGFAGITRTGIETFSVDVKTSRDNQSANNDFTWAITIVE